MTTSNRYQKRQENRTTKKLSLLQHGFQTIVSIKTNARLDEGRYHRRKVVSKCALPEKRLPPWVGKLREAVMRGIARRSRISFRQEYRVRKDISCRQAYRLREAQQKRYSADAERYACLRKHDMFAFANTICGVMPAQIENHPLENHSSAILPDGLSIPFQSSSTSSYSRLPKSRSAAASTVWAPWRLSTRSRKWRWPGSSVAA